MTTPTDATALILARSGEGWKSGPIGLAVILALCVAVYFLFKSMSKHLRKVREEFPTDEPADVPADAPAAAEPAQPIPAPKADSGGGDERTSQAP
jgi:hypothetical protein